METLFDELGEDVVVVVVARRRPRGSQTRPAAGRRGGDRGGAELPLLLLALSRSQTLRGHEPREQTAAAALPPLEPSSVVLRDDRVLQRLPSEPLERVPGSRDARARHPQRARAAAAAAAAAAGLLPAGEVEPARHHRHPRGGSKFIQRPLRPEHLLRLRRRLLSLVHAHGHGDASCDGMLQSLHDVRLHERERRLLRAVLAVVVLVVVSLLLVQREEKLRGFLRLPFLVAAPLVVVAVHLVRVPQPLSHRVRLSREDPTLSVAHPVHEHVRAFDAREFLLLSVGSVHRLLLQPLSLLPRDSFVLGLLREPVHDHREEQRDEDVVPEHHPRHEVQRGGAPGAGHPAPHREVPTVGGEHAEHRERRAPEVVEVVPRVLEPGRAAEELHP
eukprot:31306-Pelagococcus_subviridis.AAC.12